MQRFAVLFLIFAAIPAVADDRPNILWIIVDDMSAHFSCYGEKLISTPHVDRLAVEGVQFNKAFVTAPVCSTCRSAFITGMYQTSIGAHHHRSGRGEQKIRLPDGVELLPALFQKAGYYTTVSSWPTRGRNGKGQRLGKTDYNFEWDKSVYDSNDWSGRKDGQPFFAQIQLQGGKLRGGQAVQQDKFLKRVKAKFGETTKPDSVTLPPYYPREEVLLKDWAAYLDSVRMTDAVVGEIVQRLKDEGAYDNTLVLFMTDHGISHARGKQFLYEEGIHVPLVIRGPGVEAGTKRDDLVEHIDIAALSLGAAGISIPKTMQARDILAEDYKPREFIVSARDRCDETVEHLRCVRSKRFKYIRNFLPNRPHLQPCAYKDKKDILVALRKANASGKLDPIQKRLFAPIRPQEELYDLDADPHEIRNLADDPAMQTTLATMRQQLSDWMNSTNDHGRTPEPAEMYDSDMTVYLERLRSRGDAKNLATIEANIAQMKKWASEGK